MPKQSFCIFNKFAATLGAFIGKFPLQIGQLEGFFI